MEEKNTFRIHFPITVRYGDLDPQGHVNNAVYFTYLESARLGYYEKVGLWSQESGMRTGFVAAHNEIDYLASITLGQSLSVGVRVERLGTKSLTFIFQIQTQPGGKVVARGKSVMVAYDNDTQRSIPIPPKWRDRIVQFEEIEGNNEPT